jgi:hypothetical protein
MPVDRFFHPRAGHSRKVTSLTDLEFRAWWTYQMAADDFGVMRRSAVVLQAANDALAKRSRQAVERAFDRVIEVGLLVPFEHQDEWYVCQLDWQDFQKVKYPRESHQPVPPPAIFQKCSDKTRELFAQRSGKVPEILLEDSPRAGAREEANGLRLEAKGNGAALRGGGAASGQNPRDHLRHASCDTTFSRCVPNAVHDKLANMLAPKHNGDRQAAKAALVAWYPTVWASLPSDFVMPDAFKFWQGRFDAAFASADPGVPKRPNEPRSTVPGVEKTAEYLRSLRQA